MSFGVVADCQAADVDDFSGVILGTTDLHFQNCYRMSAQKLQQAADTFTAYNNERGLDYIVHLGDFYDRDMNDAHALNRILGGVGVRVAHLIGNHEFMDKRATLKKVLQLLDMPHNYYSLQKGKSRLVMLDTNELGPLEHPEGSPEWIAGYELIERMRHKGATNAYMWNGGMSDEQLEWFDNELTDAEKHDQVAIPMSHHQLFPHNALTALNSNEIMDVINRHDNVRVFMNGHNHGGAYGLTREGVIYITLPGMLSGETNAYGLVDVYEDRFELKGFGTRVLDTVVEFPKV